MLDLSKSMVTCSIVGDAYENRWWYIALLVGYKATAEHYRGSEYRGTSLTGRLVRPFYSIKLLGQLHVYPQKCVEILQKELILDSQINVQINVK